jgi:hypothetical protein
MTARDENISESYFLAGAITATGNWLDSEYVSEILELTCIKETQAMSAIDRSEFDKHLKTQIQFVEREVQTRNSRYYDQQEELLYRNQQDRKAEHEGQIREFRTKEKEARKAANNSDDPMEQLRMKKEARRWEQKAEDADEEFRSLKKKLRQESDMYLELIEQALKGDRTTEHIFTIKWKIVA